MPRFPCPTCGTARDSADSPCEACGWKPKTLREAERPLPFRCPECGASYETDPSNLGKPYACDCGARFEIEEDPEAVVEREMERFAEKARKKTGSMSFGPMGYMKIPGPNEDKASQYQKFAWTSLSGCLLIATYLTWQSYKHPISHGTLVFAGIIIGAGLLNALFWIIMARWQ